MSAVQNKVYTTVKLSTEEAGSNTFPTHASKHVFGFPLI